MYICHAQYHANKHLGKEKCEDTIGVMRSRKSKTDRQYNGQNELEAQWTELVSPSFHSALHNTRYRSSDQCVHNAFRSPERYNGWFREQLGQRFPFFNFFPMITDDA
jgi:hypothetical protein